MTIRDPNRDEDDLLRDGGGELGDLYRRLPRYEPPRRLDRAILGEAARAVHSGRRPRQQRWLVGVGSAAGLVLAAGIAWRIGHDPMATRDAASSGVVAPAVQRVVPVQPISESARARHDAAAQDSIQPAQTPVPASPSPVAGGAVQKRTPNEARKRTAQPAKAEPKPLPSPAAAPAPVEPASVATAPLAFPEAQTPRQERQDLDKSTNVKDALKQDAAAANKAEQPSPAVERGRASPTPPSGSVELQRDLQLAPQDWLSHIRQLNRDGRSQQATESLRLFERAHPDWPIPDDLRALRD